MMHPTKVFLYFLFASAIAMSFGLGVAVTGTLLAQALTTVVASAIVGAFSLGGGMGITIASRSVFGLMQTGRAIQWPAFIVSAWAGLAVVGLLFSSVAVTSGLFASLAIFAMAFGWGYFRKEIPWKGRTWLPKKMPNRK